MEETIDKYLVWEGLTPFWIWYSMVWMGIEGWSRGSCELASEFRRGFGLVELICRLPDLPAMDPKLIHLMLN